MAEVRKICKEKKLEVQMGSLEISNFKADDFDVITSFEVIEHINTPVDEIQRIRNLLRTGGLFYCTTPNFNSIQRYLLKAKHNIISYPEHLTYFSPRTINKLMNSNGFTTKKPNRTPA